MLRNTLRLSVALALATAFHAGAVSVPLAAASPAAGAASIILPPWCPRSCPGSSTRSDDDGARLPAGRVVLLRLLPRSRGAAHRTLH